MTVDDSISNLLNFSIASTPGGIENKEAQGVTMYPPIPTDVVLREVPITGSEVISWNTADELTRTHSPANKCAVPEFILGDEAEVIFCKYGDSYARVGEENIKIFDSSLEAWEEACYDASSELQLPYEPATFKDDRVIQKAKDLINSLEWWNDIY